MNAIALTPVTAKCPICGEVKAQISATREHAVRVVTDAMNAHLEAAHPEEAK